MKRGCLALALFAASHPGHADIVYVKQTASGANDGSSWDDAFTHLQTGIGNATPGDQVWVAAGTYHPNDADPSNLDRTQAFALKNGVEVYGGFAGDAGALEERDPAAHPVVLSGDLNGDDVDTDGDGIMDANTGENAYHLFYHPASLALDASAVLDSVTIRGGRANGPDSQYKGGAIYNEACSPTLINCTLRDNSAPSGGAIWNFSSSPALINCTMADNSASQTGGAIHNQQSSSPTLSKCVLTGNSAFFGGAIHNQQSSSPTLALCSIADNSASESGGAIYNRYSSSPTLSECVLTGNSAPQGGAIYNNNSSSPVLTFCSMADNTAPFGHGGVIFNSEYSSPTLGNCTLAGNSAVYGGAVFNKSKASPNLSNCTLADNSGSMGGGAIYNSGATPTLINCTLAHNSSTFGGVIDNVVFSTVLTNCIVWGNLRSAQIVDEDAVATHCIIEGGFPEGTMIFDVDPLLLPLGDYGGQTQTMPIAGNSPAIAQALKSGAPPTDQRGIARDGSPDIGAFEFQFGLNAPQITIRPDGMNDLLFQGTPGQSYRIERSTNMTGWTTISTVVASPTGRVAFTDENPPPGRVFYRLAW